jgi:hypothetical protein
MWDNVKTVETQGKLITFGQIFLKYITLCGVRGGAVG